MISGLFKRSMSGLPKVNKVVISSFVPGLHDYIVKHFRDIEFYFIPVQKISHNLQPILNDEAKAYLNNAEVIMADAAVGAQLISYSPRLKWLQAVSAGVESFFKNIDLTKVPSNLLFSRMTGVFGNVMAEYVICQIVNKERSFFQIHENQKLHKWDQIQWGYRLLSDLTVGVMGLGEIGKEIARLCKAFGATTIGLSRSLPDQKESYIDHHKTMEELPAFLKSCDYIVSVLPSTPQTKGLLDNGTLAQCVDKKPVLINIGRGDLIADEEVIKAIGNKWISGAVLDVFSQEPLPSSHPFWSVPEITITPHVSGTSMPTLIGKVFRENLERYEQNKPLLGLVDLQRQY